MSKRGPNLEVTVKRIWILTIGALWLTYFGMGCGDKDASISLLSASMDLKLAANEPKKLQMVIVGDPTKSMIDVQRRLEASFPSFAQRLVETGFNFDIFCSTIIYNGGEITSLKVQNYRSNGGFDLVRLSQDLGRCINTNLETDDGDERGLEAAKKTWEKVMASQALDPEAVKLTMIVTNEDDCSRDLGQFPKYNADQKDENGNLVLAGANCIDQSARPGTAVPMTDTGYANNENVYSTDRYTEFFNKYLTYQASEDENGLSRRRGHIFAPVIMQPPSDAGRNDALACVEEKKADAQSRYSQGDTSAYVMSFGQRYADVASSTNNRSYSLCGNIENILYSVNDDVQNEVSKRAFFLARRPADPTDLKITVQRKIADQEKAASIINDMARENNALPVSNQWSQKSSTVWERVMTINNGFTYLPQTNEILLDDRVYAPYNDILSVNSYSPAGFDGKVNYGSNEHLNQ